MRRIGRSLATKCMPTPTKTNAYMSASGEDRTSLAAMPGRADTSVFDPEQTSDRIFRAQVPTGAIRGPAATIASQAAT